MSLITVSSALPSCGWSRRSPAARRRAGSRQQTGHADHAVHRRADLVAHVGEELALGAAGRVGLLDHVIELLHLLADDARGARAEQHEQRAAQTEARQQRAPDARHPLLGREADRRHALAGGALEFAAQSGVDAERLADLVDHEFAFRLAAQGIAARGEHSAGPRHDGLLLDPVDEALPEQQRLEVLQQAPHAVLQRCRRVAAAEQTLQCVRAMDRTCCPSGRRARRRRARPPAARAGSPVPRARPAANRSGRASRLRRASSPPRRAFCWSSAAWKLRAIRIRSSRRRPASRSMAARISCSPFLVAPVTAASSCSPDSCRTRHPWLAHRACAGRRARPPRQPPPGGPHERRIARQLVDDSSGGGEPVRSTGRRIGRHIGLAAPGLQQLHQPPLTAEHLMIELRQGAARRRLDAARPLLGELDLAAGPIRQQQGRQSRAEADGREGGHEPRPAARGGSHRLRAARHRGVASCIRPRSSCQANGTTRWPRMTVGTRRCWPDAAAATAAAQRRARGRRVQAFERIDDRLVRHVALDRSRARIRIRARHPPGPVLQSRRARSRCSCNDLPSARRRWADDRRWAPSAVAATDEPTSRRR